ncbi:low molecular weight protein-tyrosine-phosphatase [Alcanivorax sp. 1008]|uniref:low molecular weight protein-tyrosine-phosphatase n=1 Tax=Alcanivorax sp. 1008 TaxID=2816853 RepID=UPI001D3EEC24|nr:low molecular weight protein-tyrosine-phosphatase [Alcanivorax sp. 1008]MCC1495733.1 low molecular weight phosphotyrosine protein phosphatase [Alcanivorax sp. 1008]
MFEKIVVVCTGNICRSPTAAAMLAAAAPAKKISSAGLAALVNHEMDGAAREVAEAHGLSCPPHQARQLDSAISSGADLLLVMDKWQRNELMQRFPMVSGKTFLLSHWNGGHDIPDPYQRDRETFEHVYKLMEQASNAWLARL